MARHRMTRREMQAKTRRLLMDAASHVCSKRGLQQASIDEVAETAGFTKGAFYANFKNKEELFLSILDDRFADRLHEIDEVTQESGDTVSQARQVGLDFHRYVSADPNWNRMFFEFAAYAARNEDFRAELVTRYRALRERIAEVFERRVDDLGGVPPISAEQTALMTFAMANGMALEQLLEPEAISEDVYATMLAIFFTGLRALARESDATTPAQPGATPVAPGSKRN